MAERIEQASKGKCQKQRIANGDKFNSYWDEIIFGSDEEPKERGSCACVRVCVRSGYFAK